MNTNRKIYATQSFPFAFTVLVRLQLHFCMEFQEGSFNTIGEYAYNIIRHDINMINEERLKGLNTLTEKSEI